MKINKAKQFLVLRRYLSGSAIRYFMSAENADNKYFSHHTDKYT